MSRPARVVVIAVVAVVVIVGLFTVVFPWVDRQLIADPVMEGSAPGVDASSRGEDSAREAGEPARLDG